MSQWGNWTGGDEQLHQYAYGAFTNCNIIDNRERIYPIRSVRDSRYTLIWSPRHDEEVTSNITLTRALRLTEGESLKQTPNTAASWVLAARQSALPRDIQLVDRLHHRPEWALYDRQKDPEELDNLAGLPTAQPTLNRLRQALTTWLARWDDQDPVATERRFVREKKR